MTLLDDAPGLDLARGVFEYDLGDLEDVGVRLRTEQMDLWREVMTVGEEMVCITPAVVESPTGYRQQEEPLVTWDADAANERLIWFPQPVVVRWDPEWIEGMAPYRAWNRFPSLPGLKTQVTEFHWEEYEPEPFRLWDLWPIHMLQVDEISKQVSDWWHDQYFGVMEFMEMQAGQIEMCDWAQGQGHGAVEEHDHRDHTGNPIEVNPYEYQECRTATEAEQEWLKYHCVEFLDDEGEVSSRYLRFWGEPDVPFSVKDSWDALLQSSRTNAERALGVFPPWDRDEALIMERRYNPWLWSF